MRRITSTIKHIPTLNTRNMGIRWVQRTYGGKAKLTDCRVVSASTPDAIELRP